MSAGRWWLFKRKILPIWIKFFFQVGNLKNTRYVTVTSTFEKSFEPTVDPTPTKVAEPLTENILATNSNYKDNNFLDSSIATLPAIYLASDVETPPLETLTETFSTTQTMLKTHILPVVRFGNDTISSTLVQTYFITRWVSFRWGCFQQDVNWRLLGGVIFDVILNKTLKCIHFERMTYWHSSNFKDVTLMPLWNFP